MRTQALKKQYKSGVLMEDKAIVNLGKDGIELQFVSEPLLGWTMTRTSLYKKVYCKEYTMYILL